MTATEEKTHLERRQQEVQKILEAPASFKVCDQCRSISRLAAKICPICHAYRWNFDSAFIVETANLVGSSPFPFTAGTVPRI